MFRFVSSWLVLRDAEITVRDATIDRLLRQLIDVADDRDRARAEVVELRMIGEARARAAHPSTRDHCNPHGLPRPGAN